MYWMNIVMQQVSEQLNNRNLGGKRMNLYLKQKNSTNLAKALRREKVECVPVLLSDQLNFLGGWLNLDGEAYHLDAKIMLDAQIEFNKRFQGTGILGPNFGVCLEPSAFGAKIKFSKIDPPWVIKMCEEFDDLKEYVNQLKEPNPMFDGYLPLFYQTYFHMNNLADDQLEAPLGVIASFDIAALLVGLDNLFLSVKLEPETAHKLLGKINRFLINFIETKAKLFGVTKFEIIDIYGDYAGYLSREDFMEFIAPYNKEIYNYFSGGPKTVNWYHCDGTLGHLIDLIPETGCNCLYSFDPYTDIDKFIDKIGDKVSLVGNIDPINVLRNGTTEEVQTKCKEIIQKGKRAEGFVMSAGGELVHGTPPENIDILLEAVKLYGKY
jgi:uroporphyrinogen decarboxylase